MPRAASLARASEVNRRKNKGNRGGGGGGNVDLGYDFPEWVGPPPGTFDPGLEAQVRASERGLLDLIEQTEREAKRGRQDTAQSKRLLARRLRQDLADLRRGRGYAVQDAGNQRQRLETSFARDIQDLAIAKQRGEENYNKALVNMQHRYAVQAARQGEAQLAQGTFQSGTQEASGAVRSANALWDKGEIDFERARDLQDLALGEGRTREDYATNLGLLDEGLARELGGFDIQGRRLRTDTRTQRRALGLNALRAQQDRATRLSQAKREQGIYATDVAQQAYYQAHELNPNIVFPTPNAVKAPGGNRPLGVAVGVGRPVYPRQPRGNGGTSARRPYLRY